VGGRWVASNGVGWTGRIETVFDELVTGDQVAGADDGALIDAITGWARAEATVTAHRLAAIAELAGRRCGAELAASREQWACDGWDSAAAEIAAALTIGHRAIPRRPIPARTAAPSTATPKPKRKSDPTPLLNPLTPLPCPKPTLRPRSPPLPPLPPLGPPAAPPPR